MSSVARTEKLPDHKRPQQINTHKHTVTTEKERGMSAVRIQKQKRFHTAVWNVLSGSTWQTK